MLDDVREMLRSGVMEWWETGSLGFALRKRHTEDPTAIELGDFNDVIRVCVQRR
jgi:hypothetical protein